MSKISYRLDLNDDGHVIVKVKGKPPDNVYVPGKTRVQLTRDVLFFLHVSGVPVNKDRLQNELDEMIWNHVPKRDWY